MIAPKVEGFMDAEEVRAWENRVNERPGNPFALVDTFRKSKYATHDVGQTSRIEHPWLAWCLRCGRTEPRGHWVRYSDTSAMMPLCRDCWEQSTDSERVEYCRALFRSWLVGALNCAWSSNVAFREDHPHWQKIRNYLERSQAAEAATIPPRMCTLTGMKKKCRGTWWKPWTWCRGSEVTFEFKVDPRSGKTS